MASITQKIQRYTGGVSDQPDELKIPGQLVKAENVIPDITLGLLKRPGLKHVGDLSTDETGKWFSIHKNNVLTNDEQYIGQIKPDGKVRIWDAKTGKRMTVCYTESWLNLEDTGRKALGFDASLYDQVCGDDEHEPYFKHDNPDDLSVLTVNDYTFVTNRKRPVSMDTSDVRNRPFEAYIELKQLAYQQQYLFAFNEPNEDPNAGEVTTTSASRLSVKFEGWGPYQPSGQGNCTHQGSENVTVNRGDKQGLNFTITVNCQAVPDPTGVYDYSDLYSNSIELFNGGVGWEVGDSGTVDVGGRPHSWRVEAVGKTSYNANVGLASAIVADTSTVLNAQTILNDLKSDIEGFNKGFTVEIIGNGLYITRDTVFSVTAIDPVLGTVISGTVDEEDDVFISQVNNVSQLPFQCKHGYIARVANSFVQDDDYYVQFYGDNNADGSGVWEECAKPGIPHAFNATTMPHCIIRTATVTYDADGDLIASFLVGPNLWDVREAGDENTNPRPSFAPRPKANFGRPINSMLFFRNRLVFLSDENVIMSRAGNFFNLWGKTAMTVTADDPIDIATSSTNPAMLYAGIGINAGLILFGANQQYLLTNDNDVLAPQTAKITPLSTYDFNVKSQPITLGTTTGFFSAAGQYSRFYEMQDINKDLTPTVIETSRSVSTLLPNDLEYIAVSKENGMVAAGKPGSNEVWLLRYLDLGDRRAQSSWFNWTLPGELYHHVFMYDSYYAVVKKEDKMHLLRADVKELYDTTLFGDEKYRIHLDFYGSVTTDDMTYADRKTTFESPVPVYDNPVAFSLDGRYAPCTVDGTTLSLDGDWTNEPVVIGYNFTMDAEFPVIYPTRTSGNVTIADTRASLILHRVMMNLGDIGCSDITVRRKGRSDYRYKFESTLQDGYKADTLSILPSKTQVTPIYDRNENVHLHLTSTHPTPTILHSMEWEGDYTNRYYRRV